MQQEKWLSLDVEKNRWNATHAMFIGEQVILRLRPYYGYDLNADQKAILTSKHIVHTFLLVGVTSTAAFEEMDGSSIKNKQTLSEATEALVKIAKMTAQKTPQDVYAHISSNIADAGYQTPTDVRDFDSDVVFAGEVNARTPESPRPKLNF